MISLPKGDTFLDHFQQQAASAPHNIALVWENEEHSYRQLANWTDSIAHFLGNRGCQKSENIGICMDRSPLAIASMLGILSAGGAFVPLDPEYPADRIEHMLADAAITRVVCEPHYRGLFPQEDLELIDPAEAASFLSQKNESTSKGDWTKPSIQGNDLAYIMYTSGSTGKPKGVQIEHAALLAYSRADAEVYKLTERDRTLQFSTLTFDIAIEEIFPPLLTGGCIVIRPRERSSSFNELSEIVQRHQVTALHLATAYWHEWVDLMVTSNTNVPSSVRLVIATGEKVSVEHFRRWKKITAHDVLWCNAYGPTEATVSSTVFIPSNHWDGEAMPIGIPLPGYTAVIVDRDNNKLGVGEIGELCIGGGALARGYLNRPDLTERAFVTLSFPGESTQRFYRTGDLARWRNDGNIDFDGRVDHQIKLGSYRIEPGEIESQINQYQGVLESLICYEEINNKKYLIAYVAGGNSTIDINELSTFLRGRLPTYMVPSRFSLLAHFPKSINGKIDRKALPDPRNSKIARQGSYEAASNLLEEKLTAIWGEVLNLPAIGIHDDFFLLGGSSLLVTRVVSQVKTKLNIELPVRDFFANPTIAMSARHINALQLAIAGRGASNELSGVVESGPSPEVLERLPVAHAYYFPSDEYQLFGVHYRPRKNQRKHSVIIAPAFGHEYARSHRNMQQLATLLSHEGFDSYRFDYACTGNSEGVCEAGDCWQWKSDIRNAIEHVRSKSSDHQISLIGIRLGATLAATCEAEGIDSLVLWDPIIRGEDFLKLLQSLHHHAIHSLTRYPVSRTDSSDDQLYGTSMPTRKFQSIEAMRLEGYLQTKSRRTLLVASRDAVESDALDSLPKSWEIQTNSDEIYWNTQAYTESAFSSPGSYRSIVQYLTGGDK